MTTTISNGVSSISPELVFGYEVSQNSRNVLHTILGRSDPEVTLQYVSLRKGTLNLLFKTGADAETARAFHSVPGVFTLTSSEVSSVNMSYVVAGDISLAIDEATQKAWTLNVDFQEVLS